MSTDLIIIGASARAAAMSALRAGLRPWCADLFADSDLGRLCPARRVTDYPRGLLTALADAPAAPVLYTGALENHPALLARLGRPLWGNPASVVRRVRSPRLLAQTLQAHGLPCPRIRFDPPSDPQQWLLKPHRSAAGFGIRPYDGETFNPRTHYLQERLEGDACSAVFLGRADGGCELLGTTRLLAGTPWLHASGFAYAGNIGPLHTTDAWHALGDVLVREFGLRGLFGVDAIVRDGVPWPMEVNPRYTASVEVLERSLGMPLLALHRAVFDASAARIESKPGARRIVGKGILYAREPLVFPAGSLGLDSADIPHAGEPIAVGLPVLTLFADADSIAECEVRLQQAARTLDRRLWGA